MGSTINEIMNMNHLTWFLLLICHFGSSYQSVSASDEYQWWIDKHNWDGHTPWSNYLIFSTAYFGPNALPVPPMQQGLIQKKSLLDFSYEYHKGSGDYTHNALADLFIPLFSDRAGLNISMVPVEFFEMDTVTRDLRRSRNFEGNGRAVGDVYIGTHIQLLENHAILPDVLLTINLRTASGSNLSSARYIDTPGYYFDVSAGKNFLFDHPVFTGMRLYGSTGFYVWQTNRDDKYFQNDAYMYGLGVTTHLFDKLNLSGVFTGYTGYIDNGDKPMVLRIKARSDFDFRFNFIAQYQVGLRDYPFNSVRVGVSAKLF
jgi:hypothetical protein